MGYPLSGRRFALSSTRSSSTPGPVQSALGLAGYFVLCFAVAAIGAHSALYYIPHWYANLVKPPFSPPDWTFTPCWVALYALMAIAAWLIWRTPRRRSRSRSALYTSASNDVRGSARLDALVVFYISLFFSLFWMEAFFHTHRLLVSAVVILALWIAIAFTIALFWRVRPLAGALMLVCLAMVSFATALNLALLRLN
jgi:benzodiazapine receptor